MFLHTVEMRSLRKSHHINSPIKISFFELFLQPNDDIEISFYYKMVNRFHDYYVSAKVIKRQNILYKTTENSSTLSNRLATESHLPIVVGHSRIFIEIKDEIQMQFLVNYVQENKYIAEEKIQSILDRLETVANNSKIPDEENMRVTKITGFSVNYQVRLVDIFTLNQLATEIKELQKIDQSYEEIILIDRIEFLDR